MWLEARHTVRSVVEGVDIIKGERVLMEVSRKFTVQDICELAFKSGFFIQVRGPRLPVSCRQAAGVHSASAGEALRHCSRACRSLHKTSVPTFHRWHSPVWQLPSWCHL